MQQTTGDFALFFITIMHKLVCISGSYFDDILQAEAAEEDAKTQQNLQKYLMQLFQIRKVLHIQE